MATNSSTVQITTPDGPMSGFLARPSGEGKYPTVLVIMEAFGLNAHIKEVAGRLAGEGYVALAPDVYHRQENAVVGYDELPDAIRLMTTLRDDGIISDLNAALAYLQAQPFVRADRIGITGFCMGGRISFLAASIAASPRRPTFRTLRAARGEKWASSCGRSHAGRRF